MSDWSAVIQDSDQEYGVLSTHGSGSPVAEGAANAGVSSSSGGTTAWPSANLAIFVPMLVRSLVSVSGLAWYNGATLSGNVDAGVYDRNGTRLVSKGSTAQAGISAIQPVSVGATTLPPGLYYLALAVDNNLATFVRLTLTALLEQACGMQQMAAAFPLPATATFANPTGTMVPLLSAQIASAL